MIEAAVADVCELPRAGLRFSVDEVEALGSPPHRIRAWATLHFTAAGSPFCCGEAGCHLSLFAEDKAEVGEIVRRAMHLRQSVTVEFGRIAVDYGQGVCFRYGQR